MTSTATTGSGTLTPRSTNFRVWWVILLPAAGALIAAIVLVTSWTPRLPAEVANQWAGGQVKTVRSLFVTVLSVAAPAVGAWAVLAGYLAFGQNATSWIRRSAVGALSAILVTVVLMLPIVVAPSLAVADPWLAPDPGVLPFVIAVAIGVGMGILAATFTDTRSATVPQASQAAQSATLWMRTFTAPLSVAVAVTGVVLVVIAATGVFWWGIALIGGAAAAVGMAASRWSVVISEDAMTAAPVVGVGRIRIPRDGGALATAEESSGGFGPLGWGLQIGRGGHFVLAFSGSPTLMIHRPDGSQFGITVPGADDAAQAFNNRST